MSQIKAEVFNRLLGVKDSYQAPEKLWEVLYDRSKREKLMHDVLKVTDMQVDVDTFREYFENEHADRKQKKQDFTPVSIANLTARLVGDAHNGMYYEGCAGTGSMTIAAWDNDRMQHSPFDYRPSWYLYTVEELSDRAIPFLIFNLALRGMNAVVIHCDVLTREAYGAFFIQNDSDDHMAFSSINRLPYEKSADGAAHIVGSPVTWVEERYAELTESPEIIPRHVQEPVERGYVSDFTKAIYAMCGVNVVSSNDKLGAIEAVSIPADEDMSWLD